VGFVVDKAALVQVSPRILWFSPASFVPPVLNYTKKRGGGGMLIFITGLRNKRQGCGASVASAAGPFIFRRKFLRVPNSNVSRANRNLYWGSLWLL
jgi:hypothetical protein